ncbi:MAG: bifunctional folylpolyglutamate synthase/dihydrofolate synthase [Lentisphaerae bacterium]|nr:bifunctional folylpolyglutamate synthase/dihydrofolate synthase [Lentisphaerota bacterium]
MPDYLHAVKYLSDLEIFGIKLGLEQVSELFRRIGSLHEKLRFIHVAGTNGKGSTCAMLSSCLSAAGFKVGFYSSPHLVSVRERFRINGTAISEEKLGELNLKIKPHIEEMKSEGKCPTFFETTTAIAGMYFAESGTDFVVWETGMGGRFDATNIVTPVASVITGIGIDHVAHLGGNESEIAFEKAGIIKNRVPVFCANISAESESVIRKKAEEVNSPLHFPDCNYTMLEKPSLKDGKPANQRVMLGTMEIEMSLHGNIQLKNAALVFETLKYLSGKFRFDLNKTAIGFSTTKLPARFQVLKDGSILDGAHNPQAMENLLLSAKEYFPGEKYSVIFGCLADKDSESVLSLLDKCAEEFIFVPIRGSRKSMSPDELEKVCSKVSMKPIHKSNSVKEALARPHKKRFLITGSLYLAGQVLTEYFNEEEVI